MEVEADNSLLLNIIAFNSQGYKSNSSYITSLTERHDIIFLFEHWLSNAEKSLLQNSINKIHNLIFNPAEKTNNW